MQDPSPAEDRELGRFARRLGLALLFAAGAYVLFHWLHVLLLVFGSVLVAVFLRAMAEPLRRRTRLNAAWSLAATVLAILLLLAAAIAFVGAQVSDQLVQLWQALPGAWTSAQRQIAATPTGADVLQRLHQLSAGGGGDLRAVAGQIARATRIGLSSLAEFVVMLIAGVYFAAQPSLYRDGVLALAPPSARGRAEHIMGEIGLALRKWLLGTGVAMLAMGVVTAVGTALLGLPAPLALGLLSGLAEFVPIVGAVVSAVPGVLLAATQGPHMALVTVLFYVGAHQFEGQVLIPLIQRKVVAVPPALTLFAVVGFGVLFGPLGVALATPLAVAVLVVAKALHASPVPKAPSEAATETEPVGARGRL